MKRRYPALMQLLQLLVLAAAVIWLNGCAGYGGGAGPFHTVIIDAGHGGQDQGARAVSGSYEKTLALDTAQRTARILRSRGLNVIETRTNDTFITLDQRTAISNRQSGAVFVAIHYNWAPRRAPEGMETYYYSSRSMRLAANILRQIQSAYPTHNRGIKYARFHVLRENRRPAVLCELGFLSSPHDNSYVQNADVRQRLAERIAAGIIAEQNGRNP